LSNILRRKSSRKNDKPQLKIECLNTTILYLKQSPLPLITHHFGGFFYGVEFFENIFEIISDKGYLL
jgi:hypothetical protein